MQFHTNNDGNMGEKHHDGDVLRTVSEDRPWVQLCLEVMTSKNMGR